MAAQAKTVKSKRKATRRTPELIKPALLMDTIRLNSRKSARSQSSKTAPKRRRFQPSERWFAPAALAVLVATTVYWALLGAHSNAANSDQLVDSYLFSDEQTFRGAQFPATHTFFLKWPIFALGALLGNTSSVLVALTIGTVLLTVLGLAWLLWRIMRRPVPWGLTILTLSLALLLVPVQPSPETLLPLNMAMLTTRNIEYLVYLAALVLTIRTVRLWSLRAGGVALLWGVLFVSDRLFIPLAFGSLVLIGLLGWFRHRRELVRTAWHGLGTAAGGIVLSLAAVTVLSLVTNVSYADTASPYELAGPRDMLVGISYAALGILTNLGMNPAPDTLILRDWPSAVLASFRGVPGITHLAMAVSGIGLVVAGWRAVRGHHRSNAKKPYDSAQQLTWLLAGSSVAALASFIMTKHYYAGDGRYLSIIFFAAAVAVATLLRYKTLSRRFVRDWAALLLVALIPATLVAYASYTATTEAQQPVSARNKTILKILRQHPVDTVIGDYWRVLPIRALSGNQQAVMPLQTCTAPREVLTSRAWHVSKRQSFAYLLSLEKGQTDFPACNFTDVMNAFGRPSGSFVVAGTAAKPSELLLVYGKGAAARKIPPAVFPATAAPLELRDVALADCPSGSVMQIIAHPDDDLLFMSPDLPRSIAAGSCVRTVYLTAGDSGSAAYYWIGRMLGAQAAYDTMTGVTKTWGFRTIRFSTGQYATLASQQGNARISLIFLNLPDGNVHGQGFPGKQFASLGSLYARKVPTLHSVDGESSYSPEDLQAVLQELVGAFQPTELRIQSHAIQAYYADHSDHEAVGLFAEAALAGYQPSWIVQLPVTRYVGYPIHGLEPNVTGDELQQKMDAFLRYASHDDGVCQTQISCETDSAYGAYLTRQYTYEQYHAALGE